MIIEDAYARSVPQILQHFHVSETEGLTDGQAAAARVKYGRNGS